MRNPGLSGNNVPPRKRKEMPEEEIEVGHESEIGGVQEVVDEVDVVVPSEDGGIDDTTDIPQQITEEIAQSQPKSREQELEEEVHSLKSNLGRLIKALETRGNGEEAKQRYAPTQPQVTSSINIAERLKSKGFDEGAADVLEEIFGDDLASLKEFKQTKQIAENYQRTDSTLKEILGDYSEFVNGAANEMLKAGYSQSDVDNFRKFPAMDLATAAKFLLRARDGKMNKKSVTVDQVSATVKKATSNVKPVMSSTGGVKNSESSLSEIEKKLEGMGQKEIESYFNKHPEALALYNKKK